MKARIKDSSLVVFTLASQTAVGMVVWQAVLSAMQIHTPTGKLPVSGWVLALTLSALLVAFFHLGSPLKALHAFRNLKSSRLSREIALACGFSLGVGLLFITEFVPALNSKFSPAWFDWLEWLCAVLGVSMVFTMANVYRLRTAPGWGGPLTGPGFFLTSLLLGGSALAFAALPLQKPVEAHSPIEIGLIACLFLQTGLNLLGYVFPARTETISQATKRPLTALRVAGLLAAAFTLLFGNFLAATGLILLSELLGRVEFYARRTRLGV